MKNIEKAFTLCTHIDKIRVARFVTNTIVSTNDEINAHNCMMNTVLALLDKGEANCAGNAVDPNAGLFDETEEAAPKAVERKARQIGETTGGVVLTLAEKQQAEEEKRRKQEEMERQELERQREEEERAAEERRKNSFWHKTFNGIKNFGKKIMEEEE